jgi:glycosyltransferase involved in cell wall biosynthesis
MPNLSINFIHYKGRDSISKNVLNLVSTLEHISSSRYHTNFIDATNENWKDKINEQHNQGNLVANIFSLRQFYPEIQNLPGLNILWFWFETTKISNRWLEQIGKFDQIWVSSEWAAKILRDHRVSDAKIKKIHPGVDNRLYFPRTQLPKSPTTFDFLFLGKFEPRKGLDVLINAFTNAFPKVLQQNIRLLIHSSYYPSRNEELLALAKHDDRIEVRTTQLSEQELLELLLYSKCLVAPSRAEGFGMPGLEAAACGLPIIATYYSGQTEYLKFLTTSYSAIDFKLAEVVDKDFSRLYGEDYDDNDYGVWAEPSVEGLAQSMRFVYENYQSLRLNGVENAKSILRNFAWINTAKNVKNQIENLFEPDRPYLRLNGKRLETASISLLVQNNDSYLNWLFKRFEGIESTTTTGFKYIFLENGSQDRTTSLISSFLLSRDGELITVGNTNYLSGLDRISRLGLLRTKMSRVLKNLGVDIHFLLDTNVYFNSDIFVNLLNISQETQRQPGAICAFGNECFRTDNGDIVTQGHYYDTLAFKSLDGRRFWPRCVFDGCRRCRPISSDDKSINSFQDNDFNEVLEVEAAFGGLIAVPDDVFRNCHLEWYPTSVTDQSTEHDGFCSEIRRIGYSVFINRNAVVYWSPNEL